MRASAGNRAVFKWRKINRKIFWLWGNALSKILFIAVQKDMNPMKKPTLFQQIERQAEEESKQWKRKRMETLIQELGADAAEISPPQRNETDQTKANHH